MSDDIVDYVKGRQSRHDECDCLQDIEDLVGEIERLWAENERVLANDRNVVKKWMAAEAEIERLRSRLAEWEGRTQSALTPEDIGMVRYGGDPGWPHCDCNSHDLWRFPDE